jgi:excisionase family DNA binding protein
MSSTVRFPSSDRRLVYTIRRWTDAGHVSCYRTPGGQRRFAREQLDVFVSSMYRDSRDERHENGSAEELGESASAA